MFPLFMKTPKKAKRKGLTVQEHEEHTVSIIAAILQHASSQFRGRVLSKFEENEFEKVERLVELHFKYLEKLDEADRSIKMDQDADESLEEDEIYLRRLDSGLFTLQLIDYIILEVCYSSQKVKDKLLKLLQLRRGSLDRIKEIVREYAENLGDENQEWKLKQQENVEQLIQIS